MEYKSDDKRAAGSGKTTEIVFLRGFAVLAVITIHTTGYFTEIRDFGPLVLVNMWANVFSQFAVPMFICISAFVLARKYRGKFSLKTFYLKRIRAIIPPYLIFSVLYTLFNFLDVIRQNSPGANLLFLWEKIWRANSSYHLWFFAIIIMFYLFYPLIIKLYDLIKYAARDEFALLFLLVLQVAWMIGVYAVPEIKVNFIGYLFYFGLGIYACDHYDSLRRKFTHLTPLLLALALTLTAGVSFFFIAGLTAGYRFYTIPGYYFMGTELIYPVLRPVTFLLMYNLAVALMRKKSLLTRVIYRFGDYSFGIYLIHIFFTQTTIDILKNSSIGYDSWGFYPIVFIASVIISYLAVRLLSFVPYNDYLLGQRSGRKS